MIPRTEKEKESQKKCRDKHLKKKNAREEEADPERCSALQRGHMRQVNLA
jgi:hypothetical protein